VAWSADERLASGSSDNTVIVWDLESGLPAQILEGHTDSVYSVAWSAEGRLASSADDNTVQVWHMDSEEWIRQACHRAGRNLTRAEWRLYFPDEQYRKTCEQCPAGQ
jgi:WD40 repeat protein